MAVKHSLQEDFKVVSKHKIYKLRTSFGYVFLIHVRNLKIYAVNPCILSIHEKVRIRKKVFKFANVTQCIYVYTSVLFKLILVIFKTKSQSVLAGYL